MKNLLLGQLDAVDLKQLEPHLKTTAFKQHTVLFQADQRNQITFTFRSGGVVSLVVSLSTGEMIEAAMVGADGVVGASAALDGRVSLSRGIVQLAGDIIICDIDALKSDRNAKPKIAFSAYSP